MNLTMSDLILLLRALVPVAGRVPEDPPPEDRAPLVRALIDGLRRESLPVPRWLSTEAEGSAHE